MASQLGGLQRRNRGLAVVLSKGELCVTIGVNAIAERFNALEKERTQYNDPDDPPRAVVKDPDAFAFEVLNILESQDENGRTRLDELLDDACESAADRGARGLEVCETADD
jgi:hypothetical protein